MPVTIHDVAQRAGVSISTVSRVLNNSSPVREEKRRLVLAAAEALGYAPNPAALSLLGKRTGGVGALLPFIRGEFFSELLGGLDEAAQELGQFLVVSTSHRRSDEFGRAVRALDTRVDGLVVMAPELSAEEAATLIGPSSPVVFVNTYVGGLDADVIQFDNRGASRALTEHLLSLGHRRIVLAEGPPLARDAQERGIGYREAMASAGLAARTVPSGYTREAGVETAHHFLRASVLPTAVLAANDEAAMGMLAVFHAEGVSVPDAVSVTGFDAIPSSAHSTPSLTTARVPIRALGERAVRLLIRRIAGTQAGGFERSVVPVDLVVRQSTAPPRTSG